MKKQVIFAMGAVGIWATMASVVKLQLSGLPNMEALAIGSFLGALFLLAVNMVTGQLRECLTYTVRDYAEIIGLGFLGMFWYNAAYYLGLANLTSQEACILNYLWPLMIMVFAWLILKEPMTVRKIIAMLCSFAGVVILTVGGGTASAGNVLLGRLACLMAAVSYGLFSVLNKQRDRNQWVSMMFYWLTAAVFAAVTGLLTEEWVMIRGTAWIGMLWIGIAVNAGANLLWAMGINGGENTARIANLAFLTPFLSLLVSAALLGEQITLRAVTALVFIVGGILVGSTSRK